MTSSHHLTSSSVPDSQGLFPGTPSPSSACRGPPVPRPVNEAPRGHAGGPPAAPTPTTDAATTPLPHEEGTDSENLDDDPSPMGTGTVLKIPQRCPLQPELHRAPLLPRRVCTLASVRWKVRRLNRRGRALTAPRPSATPLHLNYTSVPPRLLRHLLNGGRASTAARPSATDHDHQPRRPGPLHMELQPSMDFWSMSWMMWWVTTEGWHRTARQTGYPLDGKPTRMATSPWSPSTIRGNSTRATTWCATTTSRETLCSTPSRPETALYLSTCLPRTE